MQHLAVDFVRAFHAFVPKDSEPILASNISEYYGDLSAPIFTAKTCLYWAQTLLGDGVIVRLPFMVQVFARNGKLTPRFHV